jgi:kumamolisin
MSDSNYVKLQGSEKSKPTGVDTKDLSPDQTMEITVRVRRKQSIEGELTSGKQYSRKEYEEMFGASDDDIEKVEEFAHEFHLSISQIDKARRSVMLRGKVSDFEEAFKVKMSCYKTDEGYTYRGRGGHISIPESLSGVVEGVFGLDDRPHSRPMFKVLRRGGSIVAHAATSSFPPNKVAQIYGFPTAATGKGQCIAIIELGGGFKSKDLRKYFHNLSISPRPRVVAVSVDGGKNHPTTVDSADGEVMLDIEVAGAIANEAKIVVYFAPNTDKGFLDAITKAIHDSHYNPSVISISWGSAEKNWTQQSLTTFNEAFKAASLLGVTICAAAGDQGSSDNENDGQVHVDFPSSSPYVLACGGTRLSVDGGNQIVSEVVWHESNDSATGGGISDFFPLPDYQSSTSIPTSLNAGFAGRGVPDVAGNADPNSGYQVLVDGQELVIGGTSAVAPLMAALIALVNEQRSNSNQQNAGFINPVLYGNGNICRDITQGDNITTSTNKGYSAGVGWDACTGWGVLSGL